MNTAKTLLNFVLAGTLLGILIASWAGPHFIGWYNETPLASQTMCNLPEVVRNVSTSLLTWQAVGAGIGAVVFLILGIVVARRASARARRMPPEAPPPTAPGATA